jgi:hypothetical protein
MNRALAAIAAIMVRVLQWVQASANDAAAWHSENLNVGIFFLSCIFFRRLTGQFSPVSYRSVRAGNRQVG